VFARKLFGKPVKAMKVYCRTPDAVSACSKELRKLEGGKDCLEDDVRFSMQYLLDNNVAPCGWHEIETVEENGIVDVQADKVYAARSPPKLLEGTSAAKLRILGFSMICYSKEGSPKPDRNPVSIISVATNNGEEKQFVANKDRNDKPVLEAFVSYARKFDPDIIVGNGLNTRDWPYLLERCTKLGLHLFVDRTKSEPHTSSYGHVSVTGRINQMNSLRSRSKLWPIWPTIWA
jgi:DNA polymerase I